MALVAFIHTAQLVVAIIVIDHEEPFAIQYRKPFCLVLELQHTAILMRHQRRRFPGVEVRQRQHPQISPDHLLIALLGLEAGHQIEACVIGVIFQARKTALVIHAVILGRVEGIDIVKVLDELDVVAVGHRIARPDDPTHIREIIMRIALFPHPEQDQPIAPVTRDDRQPFNLVVRLANGRFKLLTKLQ
ncbi:Clp protease N-terminal domain-containing protein [Cobetia sp. 14N.309.X.WAT.E.A4]|uniref:Clp protease N-terminal domain-containing protein n=1 Tax=Cobetia sp. 14N.309.X.WAT.E.A4 TaxID=2998323 RepID=UPI00339D9AEB